MPRNEQPTAPLIASIERLCSASVANGEARIEAERCNQLLRGAVLAASEGELVGLALHVQSVARKTKRLAATQAHLAYKSYASQLSRVHGEQAAAALVNAYVATCSATEHAASTLHEHAAHVLGNVRAAQQRPITLLAQALNGSQCDRLEEALARHGRTTRFQYVPYVAVECPASVARELVSHRNALGSSLAHTPSFARIYEVQPIKAKKEDERNDWNLQLVKAPAAWERTRGEGSVVAVIDTGIDYEHPELAARFPLGYGVDFVDDGEPFDENGHGTHVAGTVAGSTTGVAPAATLYAVRVLNASGYGSEVAVLRGIEWSIDKKVDVINMSLGSSQGSNAEERLVKLAAQKGIAVACAAGNDGDASYGYPASYDGAISVAAVDHNKMHANFSNRNDALDLSAPGVAIYSCEPGGRYQYLSGTSMATPHVAGACALLASAGVHGSEERLVATAERLGDRTIYGAGLISLAEACK